MNTKEIRQKLFDAIKEKSTDYGLTAGDIKDLAAEFGNNVQGYGKRICR